MIVLLKRSLSGMGPLRRSLLARIERLGTPPASPGVQLPLLWEGEDDADAAPSAVLGATGLDDQQEEHRLLRSVAEQAAAAEAVDSKQRALTRILNRVREPAIVFTEYRDTLEVLQRTLEPDAIALHGAMDRHERAAAVSRFNGGAARLLLATDAAAEGLNLQQHCRLVINLELPWNPMRLEQRIGRIDRIGQPRRVHVINLLASGTAEADLLARLACRLDSARNAVGALNDVLGTSDERVMAACLGLGGDAGGVALRRVSAWPATIPRHVHRPDLRSAARETAVQLGRRRQWMRATHAGRPVRPARTSLAHAGGILVTAVSASRLSVTQNRTGLLAIFRVSADKPGSLAGADDLVPVFAEGPCPRLPRRRHIRGRGTAAMASLVPAMAAAIARRPREVAPGGDESDRDARLIARSRHRRPVQRGLFDRRAVREAEVAEANAAAETGPAGRNNGSCGAPLQHAEPVLLLFLTP
jgi:hypothetical protein